MCVSVSSIVVVLVLDVWETRHTKVHSRTFANTFKCMHVKLCIPEDCLALLCQRLLFTTLFDEGILAGDDLVSLIECVCSCKGR